MAYPSKNRWVDYTVLGLSVFLIFCLLFDSYIELPNWVAWLGRFHPLVLHFPIVLLLIAIFLGLTGKKVPELLLVVGVISALVTANLGFFLGKETLVKGDLLFWHQWLGGGVALIAALWYAMANINLDKTVFTKGIQVLLLLLIGFAGHYGGMVTHGEDFLALPIAKQKKKIPENPIIYKDVVAMILDGHCVSCHNPNKQKGELLMTSLAELLKGGESGSTVVPGDTEKSEMIRRLHLPKDDEEHMPPDGKKQLDENEIQILERWIALGASDTLRLNQLERTEPLVGLIKGLMEPDPMEKWASLPKVADTTIQNLSSDYLTINRIAGNSKALVIDAYLPPEYSSKVIADLKRISNNIVELDLSGLPLGPDEMDLIRNCPNLEWLEIDKTPITDAEVQNLIDLNQLKLLKIFETSITDKSISVFKNLPNLKRLYLWETEVSDMALDGLRQEKPALLIDNGIDEETKAFFVSADSIPESDKK